ncbi:hypothetical protein [Microtetraspora niveoalba]|uniref:hypothetical protein n=1 Tax=Microtetraspora niveoalba TaxID=46175 RepID=UPI00082C0B6A|nr:hypothetical protein [Microtetraspora niveoalba]
MGDREPSLRLTDVTTTLDTALTALRAAGADLDYRVGGTSAALLQGVQLPAGDIDVLMARREDVDTFAAALSTFPCLHPASWLPEASQYFARYEINGVAIEISTVEWQVDSDGMECVGPGPWQHYVVVTCGSHRVPVVRLELRLATEVLRDRPDRYGPLIDHMGAHGFDPDLLQTAMSARSLPVERRRMIRDRLARALPA